MTQNEYKIQGKFYPLQHEEFLSACHQLTPAQLMVLYFLRTLDPYGDGVEVSVSEIARRLSTESKEVHRSTVSRALKALDDKGLIDLELMKVKVKVLAGGLHCCSETTALPTDNSVASAQRARSPRNKRDHDATSAIATQQAEPEMLTEQEFCNSKTINTYKDFIDSLSEAQRETFIAFGKKKAAELKNPPVQLPLKWIEKNFLELRDQWLQTRDENENQKQKYNFAAYSESQHQMWYGQLQTVVSVAIEFGDSTRLDLLLQDDFYNSWLDWAKTARQDVREFLANNSIPGHKSYGS
jgi:predicted transcriptional regulator